MPLFTKDNAKAFGLAGAKARWSKPPIPPSTPPDPQAPPPTITDARAAEVLTIIREQVALTREVLTGRLEPRDRAQLLGALDRLLERERVWSQRPLAKSVSVSGGSKRRQLATLPEGWQAESDSGSREDTEGNGGNVSTDNNDTVSNEDPAA